MDGREDVFSIDSKPVKVCQNSKGKRCTMGRNDSAKASAWGYCASQNVYYYGYKHHAICGISGIIHSYDMIVANVRTSILSARVQKDLFEAANIKLEAPYRLN